jgi:hypothetical protein
MHSFTFLSLLAASSSLLSGIPAASASPAHGGVVRHHARAARLDARGDNADWAPRALERRQGSATFTEYEAGLGACGNFNTDSDFVSGGIGACRAGR